MSRRPRADRPTPERTDGARTGRRLAGAGAAGELGLRDWISGRGLAGRRRRAGSHTSSWCSKRTVTSWPMATSPGSPPTIIGGEPTAGSSVSATTAIDVGRGEVGMPLVVVDGVADDGAPAGDHRRFRGTASAHRADGHRRVDEGAALRAALDAEVAVGPGGPEPVAPGVELGSGLIGNRQGRLTIPGPPGWR